MTADQARDEMLTVFKAQWGALLAIYDDVGGEPSSTDAVWSRVKVRHATGRQASLTGGLGTKVHEYTGTLWMQVFAPKGDGGVAAYAAAEGLKNAFEDASGGVWFKNIRLIEVGDSGAFSQINVLADFSYTNVR